MIEDIAGAVPYFFGSDDDDSNISDRRLARAIAGTLHRASNRRRPRHRQMGGQRYPQMAGPAAIATAPTHPRLATAQGRRRLPLRPLRAASRRRYQEGKRSKGAAVRRQAAAPGRAGRGGHQVSPPFCNPSKRDEVAATAGQPAPRARARGTHVYRRARPRCTCRHHLSNGCFYLSNWRHHRETGATTSRTWRDLVRANGGWTEKSRRDPGRAGRGPAGRPRREWLIGQLVDRARSEGPRPTVKDARWPS